MPAIRRVSFCGDSGSVCEPYKIRLLEISESYFELLERAYREVLMVA